MFSQFLNFNLDTYYNFLDRGSFMAFTTSIKDSSKARPADTDTPMIISRLKAYLKSICEKRCSTFEH
ncbi:hypothetical protein E2C01_084939 [Portunus trituberculatus]|uniref:Uncharacterized protein n=1 Tax=Portunus trituberculatus TaxID=210409 RepID=A0A5B7J649_PORTR|nr:hypothetical protein [Portunus trituberculatus]